MLRARTPTISDPVRDDPGAWSSDWPLVEAEPSARHLVSRLPSTATVAQPCLRVVRSEGGRHRGPVCSVPVVLEWLVRSYRTAPLVAEQEAVDDLPDTRDEISSPRGGCRSFSSNRSGGRIRWPVRSCPSSSAAAEILRALGAAALPTN